MMVDLKLALRADADWTCPGNDLVGIHHARGAGENLAGLHEEECGDASNTESR